MTELAGWDSRVSYGHQRVDNRKGIEMKNNWKTYVSVLAVLIAILIFVPGRQYLGPVRFRVFRDLFAIVFGLLCVFRNEDAARSAAQPQKWFFRKDTSDAIPLYRWGYLVFGSVFAIGAVVDLLAALRSGL